MNRVTLSWLAGKTSRSELDAHYRVDAAYYENALPEYMYYPGVWADYNVARVDSANADPAVANNQTSFTTNVTSEAALSIVKTATPSPAIPGATLTYQIVVTNSGPSDALNVSVTDTVPVSFALENLYSSQGGCTELPCALGTVPAGTAASVTAIGTVSASITTTLTNVASVTSDTPDLDLSDNTVTVTTPVSPLVDLLLTLQTPTMGVAGQSIWVTAIITNSAAASAAKPIAPLRTRE